ncbi:hypothetical protein AAF134_11240 [Synechococcus lacustris Tous-12m]
MLAAQKGWADALLKISADYKTGGYSKAKATATDVILAAYNYQYSPVAFKPTLTSAPQTFRPTFEGALSYFVGGILPILMTKDLHWNRQQERNGFHME